MYCKPENREIIDTAYSPSTAPNYDYWDATFQFGCFIGKSGGAVEINYVDIIDVLFDGYEAKL